MIRQKFWRESDVNKKFRQNRNSQIFEILHELMYTRLIFYILEIHFRQIIGSFIQFLRSNWGHELSRLFLPTVAMRAFLSKCHHLISSSLIKKRNFMRHDLIFRKFIMGKDLFIIDTRCGLNDSIKEAFEKSGLEAHVRIFNSRRTLFHQNTENQTFF